MKKNNVLQIRKLSIHSDSNIELIDKKYLISGYMTVIGQLKSLKNEYISHKEYVIEKLSNIEQYESVDFSKYTLGFSDI